MRVRYLIFAALTGFTALSAQAESAVPNEVAGIWRMVSAQIDPEGKNLPAYGAHPNGMLVFTPEMYFIEVLTDADLPEFESDVRGQGTDAENRAAMSSGIGFFGTYTVDETGAFSGNTVYAATFPNWVGHTRTRDDLTLIVNGEHMTEHFQRPDGTRILIEWERLD